MKRRLREVKIKRRAKDVKNVEVFWQNFLDKHELDMLMPDVWMFGDGSSEMGNRLVNWLFLVVRQRHALL